MQRALHIKVLVYNLRNSNGSITATILWRNSIQLHLIPSPTCAIFWRYSRCFFAFIDVLCGSFCSSFAAVGFIKVVCVAIRSTPHNEQVSKTITDTHTHTEVVCDFLSKICNAMKNLNYCSTFTALQQDAMHIPTKM